MLSYKYIHTRNFNIMQILIYKEKSNMFEILVSYLHVKYLSIHKYKKIYIPKLKYMIFKKNTDIKFIYLCIHKI